MKTLKQLKALHKQYIEMATNFDNEIDKSKQMIMEEVNDILDSEKLKLILSIARDYNLDGDKMIAQYINPPIVQTIKDESKDEPIILNTLIFEGTKYYYSKESSKVYSTESKWVGIFNSDKIMFFS